DAELNTTLARPGLLATTPPILASRSPHSQQRADSPVEVGIPDEDDAASHEIPGQQRVADVLSFRVARCFGRSSHDHRDDLVHHSTISAAAHSGTGISVSWDGHSIAGAGPDRLARR